MVFRLDSNECVRRFDTARFSGRIEQTAQGFLRVPAYLTRVGVFKYRRDGKEVRELRPTEEVFHEDSMATLRGAPVTLSHPVEDGAPVTISPKNVRKFSVGHIGDGIAQEKHLLSAEVTVTDSEAIEQLSARRLKDISCGYGCVIDQTAGVHPVYGRYDQIQRHIRYNHVALGGHSWGRAGDQVGLRLDKNDAVQTDCDFDDPDQPRADARSKPMETITINGVEYDVSKAAAQAYRADQASTLATEKEVERLQGRLDAKEEELKKTVEQLSEARDPKRFDSAVNSRIQVRMQAAQVFGEKAEIKGSNREIRESVLRHDNKDLDLSEKSDDYVEARFDGFMENFQKTTQTTNDDLAKTRQAATSDTHQRTDSGQARENMLSESRTRWQGPLTVSKQTAE